MHTNKNSRISRRFFLSTSPLALAAPQALAQQRSKEIADRAAALWAASEPIIKNPNVEGIRKLMGVNDLDEKIWREELDSFVPSKLCDMHSHLTRYEFDLRPNKENQFHWTLSSAPFRRAGSVKLIDTVETVFYPGRRVDRLVTPNPHPECDFAGSNRFIAEETAKKPGGAWPLMVVHPKMPDSQIEGWIRTRRYLGFKPYRWYSTTGDVDNCRITDFMPEKQVAIANRYGLIILMHVAKKRAIADPENMEDIVRLTDKYPRVRWILAHSARSYSNWALDEVSPRLRKIPSLWYDTSSVCSSDALYALFTGVPLDRICYGSDDFAVGITRGMYVTYGYSWAEMDENNQTLNRSHCDGRFTFVRYEMLRGMKRAAMYARLTKQQVEAMFYDNGRNLIAGAEHDLKEALS
jgi:Amidohydrolase